MKNTRQMAIKRKPTIADALKSRRIQSALGQVVGLPVGGWPETEQAMRQLEALLPPAERRHYTMRQLITYALFPLQGRWCWRPPATTEDETT